MGKFGDDVMKFRLKVETTALVKLKKVVFDLDRAIVQGGVGAAPGTPVDTGCARGNWQANIGPQPTAAADYAARDIDGGATLQAALTVIDQLKPGDTIWLSNALPYIRPLEYGLYPNPPKWGSQKTGEDGPAVHVIGGYSMQAPQGFVRVAIAEFGGILERA